MDEGRDLFDAFRPCYIRAYTDAKDVMEDDGTVLDGTKSSTADDFVSWGEFRMLNAFLCIYAAMYDAFAKIDGATSGGAATGRDGDDLRMDKSEWLAGYKRVTGYGFLGLSEDKLTNETTAMAVFNKIDDNGGGIVLMEEWAEYIKNCELEAGTELGVCLGAEMGVAGGTSAKAANAEALRQKEKVAKAKADATLQQIKDDREAKKDAATAPAPLFRGDSFFEGGGGGGGGGAATEEAKGDKGDGEEDEGVSLDSDDAIGPRMFRGESYNDGEQAAEPTKASAAPSLETFAEGEEGEEEGGSSLSKEEQAEELKKKEVEAKAKADARLAAIKDERDHTDHSLSKEEQAAALKRKEEKAKGKADATLLKIKADREARKAAKAAAEAGDAPAAPAVDDGKEVIAEGARATAEAMDEVRDQLPVEIQELLASDEFIETCLANFDQLDVNQNGKLEPAEMVPVIIGFMPPNAPPLTEENCLKFVEVFDRNGDKVIDRLEFFYLVEFVIVQQMIAAAQQPQQPQIAAAPAAPAAPASASKEEQAAALKEKEAEAKAKADARLAAIKDERDHTDHSLSKEEQAAALKRKEEKAKGKADATLLKIKADREARKAAKAAAEAGEAPAAPAADDGKEVIAEGARATAAAIDEVRGVNPWCINDLVFAPPLKLHIHTDLPCSYRSSHI